MVKETLTDLVNRSAKLYGNCDFLSFVDSDPYTYSDFVETVKRVREFLRSREISPGDKVILLSENQPNWGVCYFAITTLGAVVVPVLPDFHAREIASIVEHSRAVGVFTSEKMYDKVSGLLGENRWGVLIDDFAEVSHTEGKVVVEPAYAGKQGYPQMPLIPDEVEEKDIAAIIYTSGTTGNPKGVVLTHRNIASNVLSTKDIPRKLRPGDRILSILPLAHTYECTIGFLSGLYLGCRIYYLRRPPSQSVLLPALETVRPHVVISVPLLIEKIYRSVIAPKIRNNRVLRNLVKVPPFRKILYRSAGRKLKKTFGGSLKYFIVGGAPLAEEVERFLWEAEFPLAMGYGLTETSPLIAGSTEDNAKPSAVGPVVDRVEVRVLSEDPERTPGEIIVKGPNVMQGYYREEEKTKEVLREDGWFYTGDLGTLDKEGYLTIHGRLKNLILGPNGENIYPENIEAVLNEDPFVSESVVFEEEGKILARVHIDYDKFIEYVKNFAESAHGISKDISSYVWEYLDNLRKNVNRRLNSFSKLYGILEQKDPFEKTPTKKIKRYMYTRKSETPENTQQGEL
ncbi:MAG: AMP-binding protein [Spirochaetaceae bacterium]